MLTATRWIFCLLSALALVVALPDKAAAKPRKKTPSDKVQRKSSESRASKSAVRGRRAQNKGLRQRGNRSPTTTTQLAAEFIFQRGASRGPSTVGLGVDLHVSKGGYRIVTGAQLGLRQHRTLVQPHVGLESQLMSKRTFSLQSEVGLAVPIQLMSGTTAAAVAARGSLAADWHLQSSNFATPYAKLSLALGPLLTPSNRRMSLYAALQFVIGAKFHM